MCIRLQSKLRNDGLIGVWDEVDIISMIFWWKRNCLRWVIEVVYDQQDVISICTRINCKRRIIRDDPFHAAATKGVMLFADVDHTADGMKEGIFIRKLGRELIVFKSIWMYLFCMCVYIYILIHSYYINAPLLPILGIMNKNKFFIYLWRVY